MPEAKPPRLLQSLPADGAPAASGQASGGGPEIDAQWLCDAAALVEREQAHVFDLLLWGQPARGFAMRFEGQVVAYVNRCVHVPVEMDWQEGRFLDMDRRWIVCSIHGATYEPADGRCVGGPCGNGRLMVIATVEREGQVYWYPSANIRPLTFEAPAARQGSP